MNGCEAEDIYFTEAYSKLYEKMENGETVCFQMDCPYGRVRHLFLKRPVPKLVDGIAYYDAVTAYGYGGPMICSLEQEENISPEETRKKLLDCFSRDYAAFCAENRIVAEFVRFHPVFQNGQIFEKIFSAQPIRNTVGTDLAHYPDFPQWEYSRRCRKNIRACMRAGMTVEVTQGPESLEEFAEIYRVTMDRNNADDAYYWDEDYFDGFLRNFREHILLVKVLYQGKMIAAAMDFVWGDVVTIHLSGTLTEYLHMSPAYLLRYGVTLWARDHGCRMVYHGGGRTNDPEDTLYLFKKQFGERTVLPFYVGRKVWNREIYERLSAGCDGETWFPAYRGKSK